MHLHLQVTQLRASHSVLCSFYSGTQMLQLSTFLREQKGEPANCVGCHYRHKHDTFSRRVVASQKRKCSVSWFCISRFLSYTFIQLVICHADWNRKYAQLYNGTYVVAIAKSFAIVQREAGLCLLCKMEILIKDWEIDMIRNGEFGQRRILYCSFLIKLSHQEQRFYRLVCLKKACLLICAVTY